MAAGAFALGTILILLVRDRIVWIAGAMFQVLVIAQYFNVAPDRTPSYEVWGIVLRIIQVLLLVGLIYLVVRSSPGQSDSSMADVRPTEPRQGWAKN